jgi:riboflavin kinase/FMN adenylyltransferase
MKTIRQLSGMRIAKKPVCLAVGFFDGLHSGHQRVLRRAIECAKKIKGEAWAMTFDPHPLKVLQPSLAPPILTSTPHKLDLMRRFGMDGCLTIPFTRQFSATSAESFLAQLGKAIPTLSHIFVGEDWRFGKNGSGDTALLTRWARARGIQVSRVVLVRNQADLVSSTGIRNAVSHGNLSLATRLLGRPFSILGTVIHGNGIGRRLGYPTANLDAHNEVRPPVGVYAVRAMVQGHPYAGVVNFGHHPTVKALKAPIIELHLIDADLPLYGCDIEVFFLARVRGERRFATQPALARQIGRDVVSAQRLINAPAAKKLWNKTLQVWYTDTIVTPKRRQKKRQKGHRAEIKYGSSS